MAGLVTASKRLENWSGWVRLDQTPCCEICSAVCSLKLVDFKFGVRLHHRGGGNGACRLRFSPDNCRSGLPMWRIPAIRILDKDRFRQDLGALIESLWGGFLKRVQGFWPSTPRLP